MRTGQVSGVVMRHTNPHPRFFGGLGALVVGFVSALSTQHSALASYHVVSKADCETRFPYYYYAKTIQSYGTLDAAN